MRERFEAFQDERVDVVVVLCQSGSAIAEWLAAHPQPFPILADEDRVNAKRWGVYARLSYDSIHLAKPASFLVGPDGIVRYARVWRHQASFGDLGEIVGANRA